MVSASDVIFAQDFNNLRNVANSILRNAYGQTLSSTDVSGYQTFDLAADSVTAENVKNLLLDLQKIHVHQIGTINSNIAAPLVGYKVGANEAKTFDEVTGDSQFAANSTLMGYNDFLALTNTISDFNPATQNFPNENFSIGNTVSSTRTASWGGTDQIQSIYHIIDFQFDNIAELQYFFNAGGFIQIAASISGNLNNKDAEWNSMLTAMGVVRFNNWKTTATSGTNVGGFRDINSISYTEVFRKTGSGVYVNNIYIIEAIQIDNKVRLRITFTDGYQGLADFEVTGDILSTVQAYYPDSSFVYDTVTYTAVLLNGPTVTNIWILDSNTSTPPS